MTCFDPCYLLYNWKNSNILKVICKFRKAIWPTNVQSVISAGEPIPEIWFRELPESKTLGTPSYYLAVGFLVSTAADQFLDSISVAKSKKEQTERAGDILFQQLVRMFRDPKTTTTTKDYDDDVLIDTLIFDWKEEKYAQGGYMYPKVGITPNDFKVLAEPFGRCFFAGEATNTNACCTVQAAIETGQRAAEEVVESVLMKY